MAMVGRTLALLLLQLVLLAREDLPKYELTLINCIASLHWQIDKFAEQMAHRLMTKQL